MTRTLLLFPMQAKARFRYTRHYWLEMDADSHLRTPARARNVYGCMPNYKSIRYTVATGQPRLSSALAPVLELVSVEAPG